MQRPFASSPQIRFLPFSPQILSSIFAFYRFRHLQICKSACPHFTTGRSRGSKPVTWIRYIFRTHSLLICDVICDVVFTNLLRKFYCLDIARIVKKMGHIKNKRCNTRTTHYLRLKLWTQLSLLTKTNPKPNPRTFLKFGINW